MKTVRDIMKKSNNNLCWCKPVVLSYKSKTAVIAQNEGTIVGLMLGTEDQEPEDITFGNLANYLGIGVNDLGESGAECLSDIYDYTFDGIDVVTEELPCRECPWFDICEAMDQAID